MLEFMLIKPPLARVSLSETAEKLIPVLDNAESVRELTVAPLTGTVPLMAMVRLLEGVDEAKLVVCIAAGSIRKPATGS